jgi:hypothetical protein
MLNVGNMNFDHIYQPDSDTATKALVAQAASQGFANDVFRFLHERGSTIDLFTMQRFDQVIEIPAAGYEPDANGHQYPNYAYMKSESPNRLGTPSVVAVPVR